MKVKLIIVKDWRLNTFVRSAGAQTNKSTMPPKVNRENKEQGDTKESEQLNDIQQNIGKILSVLTSVDLRVKSVETKVESLDKKIESIVLDVHDQGVRIDAHEKRINSLEKQLETLEDELDVQDNRMRKNNIRILNLPEEEEGDNLTEYLVNLISKDLGVEITSEDLERCHRIGIKQKKAKYPRMIIMKLWKYQIKINILKAQGDKETKIRNQTIRFVQDLSVKLRRRRRDYLPVRQELDKSGIKSQLRYPATLWVWKGRQKLQFTTAEEARDTLKISFPSEDSSSRAKPS